MTIDTHTSNDRHKIEDDTGLTVEQVERYRHHTDFLRGLKDGRISTRFLPGFIRYELDPNTGERCLWGTCA